jgi:hypothetical protein
MPTRDPVKKREQARRHSALYRKNHPEKAKGATKKYDKAHQKRKHDRKLDEIAAALLSMMG